MIGFIKKDLKMVKSNGKILLILLIVYGIMAYEGQMDLSFLLPFLSAMIMISTFSYDTYNKWDAYAVTLPNGRKNSVKAKYVTSFFLILLSSILVVLLTLLVVVFKKEEIVWDMIFSSFLGSFCASNILLIIMYPSIYKFGVEKARIGIFFIIFCFVVFMGIISKFVNFSNFLPKLTILDTYDWFLIPIVLILLFFLSYKISDQITAKKEF